MMVVTDFASQPSKDGKFKPNGNCPLVPLRHPLSLVLFATVPSQNHTLGPQQSGLFVALRFGFHGSDEDDDDHEE
jgi:hypothetical protein